MSDVNENYSKLKGRAKDVAGFVRTTGKGLNKGSIGQKITAASIVGASTVGAVKRGRKAWKKGEGKSNRVGKTLKGAAKGAFGGAIKGAIVGHGVGRAADYLKGETPKTWSKSSVEEVLNGVSVDDIINAELAEGYRLNKGHQILGGSKHDEISRFLKARHTKTALKVGTGVGAVVGAGKAAYDAKKAKGKDKPKGVKGWVKKVGKGAVKGAAVGAGAGLVAAQKIAKARSDALGPATAKRYHRQKDRELGRKVALSKIADEYQSRKGSGEKIDRPKMKKIIAKHAPKSRWAKANPGEAAKLKAAKAARSAPPPTKTLRPDQYSVRKPGEPDPRNIKRLTTKKK